MIPEPAPYKRTSPHYSIDASWPARIETPEEIADRFVRQIDRLKTIDPRFDHWTCGWKRRRKFEKVRESYAKEVAAGISRDDWGEPVPVEGYWFGAIILEQPEPNSFVLQVTAGAHVRKESFQNRVRLATFSDTIPDPGSISYPLFKLSLLSLVDVWSPMEVAARPFVLLDHVKHDGLFREPWMQYLAPPLASLVKPPASAIVEHMADGGLLMSATTETFRVDNPEHLAVAHDIARAIAPLNDLPYVKDRGY